MYTGSGAGGGGSYRDGALGIGGPAGSGTNTGGAGGAGYYGGGGGYFGGGGGGSSFTQNGATNVNHQQGTVTTAGSIKITY